MPDLRPLSLAELRDEHAAGLFEKLVEQAREYARISGCSLDTTLVALRENLIP